MAYAGDNGEALGFVNMIALTVLEEMGITEHETKVFEWSGLIPGINANRSDMVTGGMYILKSMCEHEFLRPNWRVWRCNVSAKRKSKKH